MDARPEHSTLTTAGEGAEQIATLFYWMAGGATLIWIVVIGLSVYAILSRKSHPAKATARLVIGGGAILPTIVLSCLLAYGLSIMPALHRPAPEGSLTIRVTGIRWWWRVEYVDDGGQTIETANEIHLPVGQPVQFVLLADDVIHSFWVPSLGGKMDMIPGRENRLALHPNREGQYVGVCAEYCGGAHALMKFRVVVESQQEFDAWLTNQRDTAKVVDGPGERLFRSLGCSACHAVRGTAADGVVGPDLTHFGSRSTLGAGIRPNDRASLERWITDTHSIKPGVEMPAFGRLMGDEARLRDLVDYLKDLK